MNPEQENKLRQAAQLLAEKLLDHISAATCDAVENAGVHKPNNHLFSPDCTPEHIESVRRQSSEQLAEYINAQGRFQMEVARAILQQIEGQSHKMEPTIRALFGN